MDFYINRDLFDERRPTEEGHVICGNLKYLTVMRLLTLVKGKKIEDIRIDDNGDFHIVIG